MADVIIIGGGVIGLCSAYYLQQDGYDVTVIDKGDFSDNCSYGNAGYVCPSHFVPLAAPGMVARGIKMMWSSRSPFYIEPRLDASLMRWAWRFMRSANAAHVKRSAAPLRDIALISRQCYRDMSAAGFDFAYEEKGLLEVFQTAPAEHHAQHLVDESQRLGLEARMLTANEVADMEPDIRWDIRGGLLFECDGHLYPNKLMNALRSHLLSSGVKLEPNCAVTGFEATAGNVQKVICGDKAFDASHVVLSAGAWSTALCRQLGLDIPVVGGRGYSITLEDSPYKVRYPVILQEGRVAITPMDGNKLRFGGTMEITSLTRAPRFERVKGIAAGVQRFMPDVVVPAENVENIWFGYRPCSPDGLPFIGKPALLKNVVVATGHAMVGLSLGAGTGKLVSQLVQQQTPSMDLQPFSVDRFA